MFQLSSEMIECSPLTPRVSWGFNVGPQAAKAKTMATFTTPGSSPLVEPSSFANRSRLTESSGQSRDLAAATDMFCWLVGCLMSQQQASVSQRRICLDNFTCCHTEIEIADQTFYLTLSQYTDTCPTSPSADPISPGAWQGSHWSANFEVNGEKIPAQAGFEPGIFHSRGGRLSIRPRTRSSHRQPGHPSVSARRFRRDRREFIIKTTTTTTKQQQY